MLKRKTISSAVRTELLSRSVCANNPINHATGCKGYICPLWSYRNGFFDESGKQIDHIIEYSLGGTNDISNLQVLCPCCHAVKTKRCAKQKWDFTSDDIDVGRAHMDTDKKRKRSNSL